MITLLTLQATALSTATATQSVDASSEEALLSTIIRVPQDYPTIQDAVDVAGHGSIIIVNNGTYYGAVYISDKHNISIIGNGSVVVDGNNDLYGMYISNSQHILLKNIFITHAIHTIYIINTAT